MIENIKRTVDRAIGTNTFKYHNLSCLSVTDEVHTRSYPVQTVMTFGDRGLPVNFIDYDRPNITRRNGMEVIEFLTSNVQEWPSLDAVATAHYEGIIMCLIEMGQVNNGYSYIVDLGARPSGKKDRMGNPVDFRQVQSTPNSNSSIFVTISDKGEEVYSYSGTVLEFIDKFRGREALEFFGMDIWKMSYAKVHNQAMEVKVALLRNRMNIEEGEGTSEMFNDEELLEYYSGS